WLERLRQLDERARIHEFANLPAEAKSEITKPLSQDLSFNQKVKTCGRLSVASTVSAGDKFKKRLANLSSVPDDYQNWKRIAGAYLLLRYFAAIGISDLHQELNEPFRIDLTQIPVAGVIERYGLDPQQKMSEEEMSAMFDAAYRNPLQLPLLETEQLMRLFIHFAPIWEIDTRNGTDRIGTATFENSGRVKIDTLQPTVYVNQAHTRFYGENLLQLIYQIWLPAREKTGWFDAYGGELDSVIWRITLNRKGVPIAYDTIHACGCYYLLFPGKDYRAVAEVSENEPVLVPKTIDADLYRARLAIRLASRTHYLQQITIFNESESINNYRLADYHSLRSIPSADGSRRNLFGTDGIIDISRRNERFFLWPFGIDSPGAMRQWGSHAIAFIGRRHFDDPYLLERLIAPINQNHSSDYRTN
ncbi:MAG: hypothetical protein ACU84J_16265, partial [Gammaproteobacteria bacterium]